MLTDFKSKYKAVIFDMDGTILHTDHAYNKAIKEVLANHKIIISDNDWKGFERKFQGFGLKNMAKLILQELDLKISVEELQQFIKGPVHKNLPENTHMFDGFHDFLKNLNEHGIKTAIATNSDRTSFDILIAKFGFGDTFGRHLYCANDVGGKLKPDPAVFLHAAAGLDVPPNQCVVFEDSLVGLMAAKAAGMKCVLIKNHKNPEFQHMADQVFEHYNDAIASLILL